MIELRAQVATLTQENGNPGRVRASPVTAVRPWRVVLRGLGFATFGVIALWIGVVYLPLQRLAVRLRGSRDDTVLLAQRAMHRGMQRWLRWMGACGVFDISVQGREELERGPAVVVANHPSLIDTPILLSVMPQGDFIVNAAWGDNPVLRACVDAADYLRIEHGAVMVRHAVERLRAGRILVVYPEGSRTPVEGLRSFERGAAQIALLAGVDIVPVVISVHPRTLMKGQAFADVPERCPVWRVDVGARIHPAEFVREGETLSAASRRVTAALQDHFEKRWDRGIC
jgi:1-acyl-sn-glycerol-3-phosphate acyltransferase